MSAYDIPNDHPIYIALRKAFPDAVPTTLKGCVRACQRLNLHTLDDVAFAPDVLFRGYPHTYIGAIRLNQLRAIAPRRTPPVGPPEALPLTGKLASLLGHSLIIRGSHNPDIEHEGELIEVGTDYVRLQVVVLAVDDDNLDSAYDLYLPAPFLNIQHDTDDCEWCGVLEDTEEAVSHETADVEEMK
ncbi:MAG: hypothetical protein C1O27_002264 [Chloroflexi bacterium]|jgi:hypothetical protein|nr:MAG: hypothetical protein C1O27_002264 [Chloroflexota bacterium]